MSVPGYMTRISYANLPAPSGAGGYTEFAAVSEITPPALEADTIETTHLTTPNAMKTYIASYADAGECELTLEFEKTQAGTIYNLFRVQKAFQVEFNDAPTPSGSKLRFEGFLSKVGVEVDRENLTTIGVTIKVSGGVTYVPAAGA